MNDVLEARRLILRGPDGERQAVMEATERGPSVELYAAQRTVVRIHAERDSGDAAVVLPGPGAGEASLRTIGDRHYLTLFAQDDQGDGVELSADADPRDNVPRLRMIGRSYFADPLLELPEPTAAGRRAELRRRVAELLREAEGEGISVGHLVSEALHAAEAHPGRRAPGTAAGDAGS